VGVLLFCLLTPALVHLLRTRLLAWRRAGCPTGRTGIRWGRDPYCAPPAPAPPPVGFSVVAADFDALLGDALHGLPEDAHTGAWRAGCRLPVCRVPTSYEHVQNERNRDTA